MLRTKPSKSLLEQKPRKMLKIDTINEKIYNQFQGNSDFQFEIQQANQDNRQYRNQNQDQIDMINDRKMQIDEQINENQKIFQLISKENIKYKKVGGKQQKITPVQTKVQTKDIKKQVQSSMNVPKVKLQEGTEHMQQQTKSIQQNKQKAKQNSKKQQKSKPKKQAQPQSSNWKKFLQQKSKKQIKPYEVKAAKSLVTGQSDAISKPFKQLSNFVAIDCQFVKCGEQEHLARISIVSEDGKTLFDSYIKPVKKITDFITDITGITFSHIKSAPLWTDEIAKVKKILMGKILVGHTLHKDLQVTKLANWKGISQKIDISQFSLYKQKGGSKVVGLKRLTTSLLNRNIQAGWHSSVEDAVATMDLFKINKKKILKELKLI